MAWLHGACGYCEYCLTGWETLCERQQNTGYSVNGSFAEYVVAPAAYVAKIPESLPFELVAPILCAGVTTYKGLKETEVRAGQWVVISGLGGLGHLAVQYAKAMGMHVAGLDLGPEKMVLGEKLGCDHVVDVAKADPVQAIKDVTNGGAHGVLVTAVSPKAFSQAVKMLRRGGTCVLNGLPPGDFPVSIFDLVLNRLTIRGSIVGTRQDMHEALQLAAEGKVRPTVETQALAKINEVFGRMRAGRISGRIVLCTSEEPAEQAHCA